MKRILLFGATGRTGGLVMSYALEKGYAITALVRNKDKITLKHPDLKIVQGSPTNAQDVKNAMTGCDVVISTLSALPVKESMSFKKITPPHILETSIYNALVGMKELGIDRVITLSSIGVGETFRLAPWFMRLFIKISNFKIVFDDHNKQEALLMKSSLNWTIARPVSLNNDTDEKNLVVSYEVRPSPFKISRMLLAKFMVDSIDDETLFKKAPILSENS